MRALRCFVEVVVSGEFGAGNDEKDEDDESGEVEEGVTMWGVAECSG